ncbi:MAG: GatB/YqeY domain-containing protein [Candidatus Pacebacteria bacterium]|nr:GatB/YqeY domain-containing protein [Candidatus Paceibacterota bacterium]
MQNTIKDKLKEAMIAKNEVAVLTLRNIMSSFTNELVSKGKKPTDVLTDEECLTVIARLAKQRRDSIEQFNAGGRADLAENEMAELAVINEFLPAQMSEAEITEFLKNYIADNEIDPDKKGQALGGIMKELKGKADGSLVKQIFDQLI